MPTPELSPTRRVIAMGALILAGEAIFIPAFHPGRYFRTSLLEAFQITELQLGEAQAWYGIAAMISYALGGPLADRFGARLLMSGSLLATAGGSLYMATLPSFLGLRLLFGFWGVATILAFWSPMIRLTRELGGGLSQGRAFGVLDGGRGFVAWTIASLSALAISDQLTGDASATAGAMRGVLLGYAAFTAGVAVVVWFAIPRSLDQQVGDAENKTETRLGDLVRQPTVWLLGLVVLTAYCSYKTSDYFGRYLEDAYALDKSASAYVTSSIAMLRVFAALTAGWLADSRLGATRTVLGGFATLVAAQLGLAFWPMTTGWFAPAVATLAVAWMAGCGARIYFAMLAESKIPRELTGSAAGVVSFVGFTPDIFWPPLASGLIDSAEKGGDVLAGYQQLWLLLAVMSAVGFAATWLLGRTSRQARTVS